MVNKKLHHIFLVSDATGETVMHMTRAAMVQFADEKVSFTLYKNIREQSQITAICEEAGAQQTLIIYTIVSSQLRVFFHKSCKQKNIPYIDVLGPLLVGLATYFGHEPRMVAGLLHDVSEHYFQRIDAMEYTIHHDDGRDLTGLDQADIVILGISRTSKTPLSMYLSHHGWKVANIPLINGFELPKEIYELNPKRVVGLTIQVEELARIRRARLQRLGQKEGGDYADLENVAEEIEYANEIFKKNRKWIVFDATGKALEETASEIIKLMTARGLAPPYSLGSATMHLPTSPGNAKGQQ